MILLFSISYSVKKRRREGIIPDVPTVSYRNTPPPAYITPIHLEPPTYFPRGATNQRFEPNNPAADIDVNDQQPPELPPKPRVYETIVG